MGACYVVSQCGQCFTNQGAHRETPGCSPDGNGPVRCDVRTTLLSSRLSGDITYNYDLYHFCLYCFVLFVNYLIHNFTVSIIHSFICSSLRTILKFHNALIPLCKRCLGCSMANNQKNIAKYEIHYFTIMFS